MCSLADAQHERHTAWQLQAFRDNDRITQQLPDFAALLWERTGLRAVCEGLRYQGAGPCGLHANIRFYRYKPGQRFAKHVDDSERLPDGRCTGYTLLIYLNGSGAKGAGLQGGETVFYGEQGQKLRAVRPRCGMALLHLHGDECLEHEGAEVRAGAKYVLRSDVVFDAVPNGAG